jgi:hypothetical protein
MINLAEHLLIVHDVFLVLRVRLPRSTRYTKCLRRDVWDQTDQYFLSSCARWCQRYAYYYHWNQWSRFAVGDPEAQKLRSGHDWHGPFESRQAAFTVAYSRHSPLSWLPRDGWSEAWEQYAARMGLTTPVSGT